MCVLPLSSSISYFACCSGQAPHPCPAVRNCWLQCLQRLLIPTRRKRMRRCTFLFCSPLMSDMAGGKFVPEETFGHRHLGSRFRRANARKEEEKEQTQQKRVHTHRHLFASSYLDLSSGCIHQVNIIPIVLSIIPTH